MTGDRSLREYDVSSSEDAVIEDPLVFLAQPDSIILTKEFADRNHLAVNSRLTLATAFGDRQFTIRGLMGVLQGKIAVTRAEILLRSR